MRLGGPVFEKWSSPEEWIAAIRRLGYSAAFCPVGVGTNAEVARDYGRAARQADVVIAEVGAWSNPVSPVEEVRRRSVQHCQEALALADSIGAACCVTISGSRGPQEPDRLTAPGWDSPHPDNLTEDAFALVVETVRQIIDAVAPRQTYFTLETMPWMYPDSPDSYLRLLAAVDRPGFGVHLDPVNLVCSPQRYYGSAALIRECFAKLGPHLKSCHAKDILLSPRLTVHLDEGRPGTGGLDYHAFLQEVGRLSPDLPVMLEHLPTAEEYEQAAAHVRAVARQVGTEIK